MSEFRPCVDLPGLPPQYRVIAGLESNSAIRINAEAVLIPQPCPHCGARNPTKYGTRTHQILDIPRRGKRLEITVRAYRLKCANTDGCGKVFPQPLPGMSPRHQMTSRLYRWIGEEARSRTYGDIARQLEIAETTVRMVFQEFITDIERQVRFVTPEVLALVPLPMATRRVAAVNPKGRTLVGLVKSDKPEIVRAYLQSLHAPESVRAVSISPSPEILQAVHEALPHAVPFLDKAHVLDQTRKIVRDVHSMLRRTSSAADRKALAGDQSILSFRCNSIPDEHRSILEGWRARFPLLDEAMCAAEGIRRIHEGEGRAQSGREAASRIFHVVEGLSTECAGYFAPLLVAINEMAVPWANFFDRFEIHGGGLDNLEEVLSMGAKLESMGRTHSFAAVRAITLLPSSPPIYSVSVKGVPIPGIQAKKQ